MSEAGETYKVPPGLTVHCSVCSVKLEAGTECWIDHDDSSAILCLRCASYRKHPVEVGPTETKEPVVTQEVVNKAAWMEYD